MTTPTPYKAAGVSLPRSHPHTCGGTLGCWQQCLWQTQVGVASVWKMGERRCPSVMVTALGFWTLTINTRRATSKEATPLQVLEGKPAPEKAAETPGR